MCRTLWPAPLLLALGCATVEAVPSEAAADERGSAEAREAVDAVLESTDADGAAADVIEVSTDVTVYDVVTERWESVREFWASQAPCNEVSFLREEKRIRVDFGTLDDGCTFNGQTYAGVDLITIDRLDGESASVAHEWQGFTNGVITLDGTTQAVWTAEDGRTRDVRSELLVTRGDGRRAELTSHVTMSRLDPERSMLIGGFVLDGIKHRLAGEDREWTLELHDLRLLPTDAGPHAGRVVLINPDGEELLVEFGRVDEDTISATVRTEDGGWFVFHVTAEGAIEGPKDEGGPPKADG